MIAEIIPEIYDATGRQISQPFHGPKGLRPTFPMGRYVSQPLTVHCNTIEDLRQFLRSCRGVSDKKLFDKEDYWQPPDEFEKRKAGDCEDFSIWTWRQLMAMGYDARIVFGKHGRYDIGHARVTFFQDDKCFLLEPQYRFVGLRIPRLSTLRYDPKFSVAWNGATIKYYLHKDNSERRPPFMLLISLLPEWARIWGWFWLRVTVRIPYKMATKLWRRVCGKAATRRAEGKSETQL